MSQILKQLALRFEVKNTKKGNYTLVLLEKGILRVYINLCNFSIL